ncbi:5-formyltetrahydrofolate cyclo-ligase [Staphylococcus americanisciuri]|uniref:5-formyltetrahydrofolate cyclo-ligase n=1 Tax=Staphylococcus americanisciuri TaxID=2973940 RepID=A0ABT2F145_9STAP|nr:5-formyltetrahydrofolate cyclo-ligase [Staphylococcus americanisciuri]MCS4485532.1 5-formyltetrahydrofolate cyclo-ligase [Staphylococcus americanisciuri]
MIKKELRQQTLKRMRTMDVYVKERADEWLRKQLVAHTFYKNANHIGIFLSMSHEVTTDPIIEQMLRDNKQVYVPVTNYTTKSMNFQELDDLSKVMLDEKGIRYLTEDTQTLNALDLVIVPGVAFNHEGYRIGYGGGYFDRYLNTYNVRTISLIYDFQLNKHIPVEPHDHPVDKLIIAKTSKHGG